MNTESMQNLTTGLCSLLLLLITAADAIAATNRKAVIDIVQQLGTDPGPTQFDLWINDNAVNPGVDVGTELNYHISSASERHYLLVLVDPKGSTTVILPDGLINDRSRSYRQFTYPPVGTGSVTQGEPLGVETVYAIATTKPVSRRLLGIDANVDFLPLAADLNEISRYFSRLRNLTADDEVWVTRYRYTVDADTQFGTRAMRRELAVRVEQVNLIDDDDTIARTGESAKEQINKPESEALSVSGIRFETNSSVLTRRGQLQLDVLGSELMVLWEQGGLPTISLEGHTDDRGQEAYNQALSEQRADSARRYLVSEFGFPGSKLLSRGKGELMPLVPNSDDAARALNRRVDIRILKQQQ